MGEIILDFGRVKTEHTDDTPHVYIIVNPMDYQYYERRLYTDKKNTEDIIKEFISKEEKSPGLAFHVGVCENASCVEECGLNKLINSKKNSYSPWVPETCIHRLCFIVYDPLYTCIGGYSGTVYYVKIVSGPK